MRIISGELKGLKIVSPKSGTRPTSDKVRESIFNIISGGIKGSFVLDLFSGSGALGIEALSRGGASADFVDEAISSTKIIKQNLGKTPFAGKYRVYKSDVVKWLAKSGGIKYDLIFMDPPYSTDPKIINIILSKILSKELLSDNGLIVLEKSAKQELMLPDGIEATDMRKYGQTMIVFMKRLKID